ncbi:MAG: methyl-accepting chemotaxis protein, partial [Nitrospinota bacterium]
MKKKLVLGYLVVIFIIVAMNEVGSVFIEVEWKRQIFSVGFAVIAGMVLGMVFTNPVVRDIKKLVQVSRRISRGDLTQAIEISSSGEIAALADSFNKMVKYLKELVGHIQENSGEISDSSQSFASFSNEMKESIKEIVKAIENISTSAEKQSSIVEQSSSVMKKMAEATDKIARKAKETAGTAGQMGSLAQSGKKSSDVNIKSMQEVKQRSTDSLILVKQFSRRVKEIDKIAVIISEIANQTNLLALNASIEAARA